MVLDQLSYRLVILYLLNEIFTAYPFLQVIKLWGEVVHGLFGWVLPLLLAGLVLKGPSVASLLFSDVEAVLAGNDIVIVA